MFSHLIGVVFERHLPISLFDLIVGGAFHNAKYLQIQSQLTMKVVVWPDGSILFENLSQRLHVYYTTLSLSNMCFELDFIICLFLLHLHLIKVLPHTLALLPPPSVYAQPPRSDSHIL